MAYASFPQGLETLTINGSPSSAASIGLASGNPVYTTAVSTINAYPNGLTLTGANQAGFIVLDTLTTITMTTAPNAFGVGPCFNFRPTLKNSPGIAIVSNNVIAYGIAPGIMADNAALTLADFITPSLTGLGFVPTFSVIGSGTGTATTVAAVYSQGVVNAGWTITDWCAVKIGNQTSGTGTITNLIGLDVANLTKGGTNLSVRSAGAAVQMRHAGPAVFGTNTATQTDDRVMELIRTSTTSATDGFCGAWSSVPTYNGAFTITRHNYWDCQNITLAGGAAVTDGAVVRFNAAAGTHKAVDAGTTKTSPGTVSAWVKINLNGTINFIPCYTSKTS